MNGGLLRRHWKHDPLCRHISYNWGEDGEPVALNPFDIVFFVNYSDLNILDEVTGQPKGELVPMPAIFLLYVDKESKFHSAITAATLALDIATIGTGPVALLNAATKLRRAWVLFEVVNASANIALNHSELKYNPVFKDLVNASNTLVGVLGVSQLVRGGMTTINFGDALSHAMKSGNESVATIKNNVKVFITQVNQTQAILAKQNLQNSSLFQPFLLLKKDLTVKAKELWKVDWENLGKGTNNAAKSIDELANLVEDSYKAAFKSDLSDDVFRSKITEYPHLVDSWKVLKESGETGLSGRIKDIEFIDDYLKKNPGKAGTLANHIKSKGWQKWIDEVSQFGLANYSNVRKYLANSRTKQYLTNQELFDFEKTLKQAHPDVLKHMDEMDEFDFAEMVRGYRDLKNNGNLGTFENAIKSGGDFYGRYGWLSYWKLTPGIKYSLTTIEDLKKAGKLLPTGNATDIQLASLQAFTRNGDFINVPMRYNPSYMGNYAQKGLKHIEDCLEELRKVPSRQVRDEVYSGKTFSKADFESKFVGGTGKSHNYPSFISTSRQQSVAEGFIDLTKKWAGEGDKVAVIQRIISKDGVYIDDLSDWGEHLGKIRHGSEPPTIQRQYEVLLNPGNLKQTGEPILIMENGVHKTIDGMKAYYVDFTQ